MTMLRVSLGLLVLSLALSVQATSDIFNPLLRQDNLRRLEAISYEPFGARCGLFVEALREILVVPEIKASDSQLVSHALRVLSDTQVGDRLRECESFKGHKYEREHLAGSELVDGIVDKTFKKLGLGDNKFTEKERYGDEFKRGHEYLKGRRVHDNGLTRLFREDRPGRYLDERYEHENVHQVRRHLERVLESRTIDLRAQAREIDALRREVHELRKVARDKAYEVTARIVDSSQLETLRAGHEAAKEHERHLKNIIRELEEELRGYKYAGHSGAKQHGYVGGSLFLGGHNEGKKIHDPIQQAVVLSHHLSHRRHEKTPSRCYKYYLLFSYPGKISKKTITTVAKLQVKVHDMKLFFKLINLNYLPELSRTAERLSESYEESVRRIGHEMRLCLSGAEEYYREHKELYEEDLDTYLSPPGVYGHGLHRELEQGISHHHQHHHISVPSLGVSAATTSSSSTSTGSAASASAGAASASSAGAHKPGSASSAAASSAAASAGSASSPQLAPITSIESIERHRI